MSEYYFPFDKDKGGEFDGVCEDGVCEEAAAIRKEAATSFCVVCSMSFALHSVFSLISTTVVFCFHVLLYVALAKSRWLLLCLLCSVCHPVIAKLNENNLCSYGFMIEKICKLVL